MSHGMNPPRDLLSAIRVLRITRSGYDIVHLHSSKAGLIGALAGKRITPRKIFTPHALRSHAYTRGSPLSRLAVWVERAICRSADLIVAVSADEQQQIVDAGMAPDQKVRIIENGVDLEALSNPSALSALCLGVPDGAFIVGTVGRLSAQKDPLTFVRAAGLVASRIPDAHFVMVGDGPLEREVRREIASLGISHRFHLLGWKPDAVDIMKLFDVFVLASRYEGLPFVLLEAAGAGRPLVCTAAPGVGSLLVHEETALVSEIGNWHALAGHVLQLYRDPDMRGALADRAFDSVARPRHLEVTLNHWKTLYTSVAEGRVHNPVSPLRGLEQVGTGH